MDIRYSINPRDVIHYSTEMLRDEFMITNIFVPDDVTSTYSHVDRVITIGIMPVSKSLMLDKNIDCNRDLGVSYMLERRELGVINIGGAGKIVLDDTIYPMGPEDGIYVSMGTRSVCFESDDPAKPAKFYAISVPAHHAYPTKLVTIDQANKVPAGSLETANERITYQYIHPDIMDTCQLSMGLTKLSVGSVWMTMPSHLHERRMEVYFHFNMTPGDVVFHLMGTPDQTRHLVVQDEEAIIAPSWSIHSCCGTGGYSTIWAMAGENRTYTDMDMIAKTDLR